MFCLKKIWLLVFVVLLVTSVSAQSESRIFKLFLEYDGSNVKTTGFDITDGFPYSDPSQPEDAFRVEIVDTEREILYSTKFDISLFRYDDPTPIEKEEYVLRLPFYANADKIIVYDKDFPVLTVDVYSFLNPEPLPVVERGSKAEEESFVEEVGGEKDYRFYFYALVIFVGLIIFIFILAKFFVRRVK